MEKLILIAGFGFVGQAVYTSVKNSSKTLIFDKYNKSVQSTGSLDSKGVDAVFVCLPTPMEPDTGEQDATEFNWLMERLPADYQGLVIIKSTLLYKHILPWTDKFRIVVNPEFLNQNSAADDFQNQRMVLLGGTADNCLLAKEIYETSFNINPGCSYQFVSPQDACNFKYLHNIYHAYQVLFWNYAQKITGDSRKITSLYEKLYGRKPILSQVCADGYPGYGGACFPKDVNAMQYSTPHLLTEFMCRFNAVLRPNVEPVKIPVLIPKTNGKKQKLNE